MNIVTIDFDIIMAPVIGSYNDLVSEEYPIDEMIERFPYMRAALPDFYIYDYLTQYLVEAFRYVNEVYFIESHEEIIPYVIGENINLYNIDHHHDIGYTDKDLSLKIKNEDCSNWVKFLKENHKIDNYYWIHDKYTEEIEDNKVLRFIDKDFNLEDFNLLNFSKKTDKIIICYSSPWVPIDYKGMYRTWESIWQGFKDIKIDKK